jgi:hypothetical protein
MTTDNDTPEREQQVMRMLHQAAQTERAPATLRAEIGSLRTQAASRRRRRAGFRLPVRYAGALAGVTAIVVALVTTLGGGAIGPSIAQAAALAARGPVLAAPGPDPAAPSKLLAAHVGDLQFPNWESQGGWRSAGKRVDQIGNRSVTTVYYTANGHKIAYSIVSAPALSGLHTHGDRYATLSKDGRTVIVWEEDNHTCLLSAVGVSAPQLWKLAAATGT